MRERRKAREEAEREASERVYFIQGESGGPIKIGRAAEPRQRLAALQTSHHEELRLLATEPLNRTGEADLHRRFRHLRLRGEWFKAAPELLEYIGAAALKEGQTRKPDAARRLVADLRSLADQIERSYAAVSVPAATLRGGGGS